MNDRYHPIGTVVLLKGGKQPVMIYGRVQMQSTTGKTWDYCACLYPQGNIGDQYNVFFNNSDIDRVLYIGYKTQMESKILEIIKKART